MKIYTALKNSNKWVFGQKKHTELAYIEKFLARNQK